MSTATSNWQSSDVHLVSIKTKLWDKETSLSGLLQSWWFFDEWKILLEISFFGDLMLGRWWSGASIKHKWWKASPAPTIVIDERKNRWFVPLCCSRLSKHFRTSWMHARSSWQTLATASVMLMACADTAADSSPKIWSSVCWGLCTLLKHDSAGSLKRVLGVLSGNCMTDEGDILQTAFKEVNCQCPRKW